MKRGMGLRREHGMKATKMQRAGRKISKANWDARHGIRFDQRRMRSAAYLSISAQRAGGSPVPDAKLAARYISVAAQEAHILYIEKASPHIYGA